MIHSLNSTGKRVCLFLLVSLSFSVLVLAFHSHENAWSRINCPICKHLNNYSGMAPQQEHETWVDPYGRFVSHECSLIPFIFDVSCHSLGRSPPA